VPDTTRARAILDFTAETPLNEGLRSTVEWCRSNFAKGDAVVG
jgi:nucleoside-diphosphate-sugar epimerase